MSSGLIILLKSDFAFWTKTSQNAGSNPTFQNDIPLFSKQRIHRNLYILQKRKCSLIGKCPYTEQPGGNHLYMLSVSSEAVKNQVISLVGLSNFFLKVQNSIRKGELNFDFDYALLLYLQLDNCWRENKNRYIFALLAWLVQKDVFRKVNLTSVSK